MMRVARHNLTVLLNQLYDRGEQRFEIRHPAEEIGTVLEVDLTESERCRVQFTKDLETYARARDDVGRNHSTVVYEDIPSRADFRNAIMGSGILDPANLDELETFLDRYGDPDLMAGHPPVFAGIDTNLISWRIDRILGLRSEVEGIGYVNGFVLATGIRDELQWDDKCHDTAPFVDAFGDQFEEYWNQPLGATRIGRLGLLTYRSIRDIEQAVEIQSDRGDEAIIEAYDEYNRTRRSDIVLLSNDRNFVERARSHSLLGQRVNFPESLPNEAPATWREVEDLLYMLAIVFGVLELPGTTIYGVWRGKDELDWQHERIKVDARSPNLESKLEGDLSIVETYEAVTGR